MDTHIPAKRIINLTQHRATPEQLAAGVVDLPAQDFEKLKELLTFDKAPNNNQKLFRALKVANLAKAHMLNDHTSLNCAMIGGAPFFMSALEKALECSNITHVYSFSARVSSEITLDDGTVTKTSEFKHLEFVWS